MLAPNRSAAVATRRNTREAYETVYESDRLVAEYLSPERVEFYEELAERSRATPASQRRRRRLRHRPSPSPPRRRTPDTAGASASGSITPKRGYDRARELLPTATWIVGDAYNSSPDAGEFDLVICTEVLEHLGGTRESRRRPLPDCVHRAAVLRSPCPTEPRTRGTVTSTFGTTPPWRRSSPTAD